jgi:hypothetical protein
MRRRFGDIGLAAVGAALLLAAGQAAWVFADQIAIPKSWTIGETLTSADLNANFAAIPAAVNGNLDDGNLKTTAAIKGIKLADAPNGITTTKINDLAVTNAKLADNAVTVSKILDEAVHTNKIADGTIGNNDINAAAAIDGSKLAVGAGTRQILQSNCSAGLVITTVETTVVSIAGNLSGGVVIVEPSCALSFISTNATGSMTWRWKLDGVTQYTGTVVIGGGSAGATPTMPLTAPALIQQPGAGAHTYILTAQVNFPGAGTVTSPASNQGAGYLVEFR